jgi:hypothetical protein
MMNSMMLVTGTWGNTKTFKLIPTSSECPFLEGIYDRDSKVMALIGKDKKESMHLFPKLDENGDVKKLKMGRRQDGKDYAEERKTIESYYEYYVEEPSEIKAMVTYLAANSYDFDFQSYLDIDNKTEVVAQEEVTKD